MKNIVFSFVRDDQGQDLVEYGILIGIIVVGVIASVTTIGTWVQNRFAALATALPTAAAS